MCEKNARVRAFLCVEKYKSLSSLKSFLWYALQLSGANFLCFSHPKLPHCREWLQFDGCPVSRIVQLLSCVWLFVTPWIAARQASLSIPISWSSLKLMSIESVMPSSHLIFCRPLLLLPQIPPSIRVFSNESILCIRWPKYWSFSFNISPSNDHSGLIFFRMDWLDLLAVQGTLKSLPQHHSSKASILQHLAFFFKKLIYLF